MVMINISLYEECEGTEMKKGDMWYEGASVTPEMVYLLG